MTVDIGGQFLAIEEAKKAVERAIYKVDETPEPPRFAILGSVRAALGVALISAGTFVQGRTRTAADDVAASTRSAAPSGC